MKRLPNIEGNLPSLIFLLFSIILWEAMARVMAIPEYILPLPTSIGKAFASNYPLLLIHSKASLFAAVTGLFLAIIVALILGLLMHKLRVIKTILYPLLVVSQTIPIIALAPVIMIWFGLGLLPKVLIVALVCFFPLVINITDGLVNVDEDLTELMQVMGAGSWDTFKNIQLPSILPYFFSGLKISATYSVTGAVIGEWLGGNNGLGVYMVRTMHTFSTSNLFAAILVVIILSFGLFKLVELMEKFFMPWKHVNINEME
ncbi:MAG: ABC transporter permease [Peptococcales bacterium]|jgi:putative hydroxymethylpyrimidine transport system permease protein